MTKDAKKNFKHYDLRDVFGYYGTVHKHWVFFDARAQCWVCRIQFEDKSGFDRCQQDHSTILRRHSMYLTTEQGHWPQEQQDAEADRLVQSYSPVEDGEVVIRARDADEDEYVKLEHSC